MSPSLHSTAEGLLTAVIWHWRMATIKIVFGAQKMMCMPHLSLGSGHWHRCLRNPCCVDAHVHIETWNIFFLHDLHMCWIASSNRLLWWYLWHLVYPDYNKLQKTKHKLLKDQNKNICMKKSGKHIISKKDIFDAYFKKQMTFFLLLLLLKASYAISSNAWPQLLVFAVILFPPNCFHHVFSLNPVLKTGAWWQSYMYHNCSLILYLEGLWSIPVASVSKSSMIKTPSNFTIFEGLLSWVEIKAISDLPHHVSSWCLKWRRP